MDKGYKYVTSRCVTISTGTNIIIHEFGALSGPEGRTGDTESDLMRYAPSMLEMKTQTASSGLNYTYAGSIIIQFLIYK